RAMGRPINPKPISPTFGFMISSLCADEYNGRRDRRKPESSSDKIQNGKIGDLRVSATSRR
ncbi:MAG TPA: hypothetical protein VGR84_17690, partial [Candidatus Acidoferrales bacterium]|nr:hypothetical protein [Candidatus Acidoferrales bacterium]